MGKFCTNCGSPIEEGQEKCQYCGKVFGEQSQPQQTETQKNNQTNVNIQSQPKSRVAAGILGIFLGIFGVHNFYLGYTGKAVAQLLISILSCFILSFVSSLWGFIEGIMILTGAIDTDGYGNKLGD